MRDPNEKTERRSAPFHFSPKKSVNKTNMITIQAEQETHA